MKRLLLAIFLVSIYSLASSSELTKYVNPFIGTGGHGHTFPGATLPFGMVQLSPDTRTFGWDACSGYHYSDNSIIGFSHTHLSGVGIGDYGDILFMPFSGDSKLDAGTPDNQGSGYRSRFSHNAEKATPGYYSVRLSDYDILVELTATQRAGFHRYTFHKGGKSGVMIDLTHTIHGHKNPVNEIRIISDTEIEGLKRTEGWATNHFVYFRAKFSKPFTYKLYQNNVEVLGSNEINSKASKVVLFFETQAGEQVMSKVGISSVDYEGAKNNLYSEISDWNFDKVVTAAQQIWNDELGKINVESKSENDKTIFYTSLYHCAINPSVFSDSDGRYRGQDGIIHQRNGFTNYTVFSLWDTFRALHPLLTIIDPKRDNDFINALLSKYEEGGILPKWDLAGNYTGTMIGYHAVPVIVDAYLKGIKDFDIDKAYKAIIKSSLYDTIGVKAPSKAIMNKLVSRDKYFNQKLGYIPADSVERSVSIGLEYAYDDWCIAQMAKSLRKTADYKIYSERALRYKKYYDSTSGFMRGKNTDGSWVSPFNPRKSTGENDYVEGNAWQWNWFVPQDIPSLVKLMGGKAKFISKLDSLFSVPSHIAGEEQIADATGLIGMYAHGNEPSHHIAHIYNYVGQPWKTQALVDTVLSTFYMNDPDGISGNEDCGQMSAWYILNAMGFYSFCPGNTTYSVGRPIFDKITIPLENKRQFVIQAIDNSKSNKYIQSIILNGKILNKPFVNHKAIVAGGLMVVKMGPKPNYNWGK